MRTTIIPAQITTVEDKIAGNLNLTQIMLLVIPVFWAAIIYAVFSPVMKISMYKIPLIFIFTLVCMILALRIKGRVVLDWLNTISRFYSRPKYYLFTKQDVFMRSIDMLPSPKPAHKVPSFTKNKKVQKVNTLSESVFIQNLIKNPNYSFSFKSGKGGLHVAYKQI